MVIFRKEKIESIPQSFQKIKYYKDLKKYIQNLDKENIILMGDFNVAPEDEDIGIGDVNAKRWLREGKCAFLPEEREMWFKILNRDLLIAGDLKILE